MCYWVGNKKVREEMLRRAQQQPDDEIAQLFYKTFVGKSDTSFLEYYVAIGKANPMITGILYDDEKGYYFNELRWGINWSYTDNKTGKTYARELINSTCEKVFFVHRDIIFSQRCIIPLDGYYEFFHFSGQVYPHFLKPRDGVFYAAGVWTDQVDTETGELTRAFSILTTPPNPLAEKLHNNPKAPNGPRMLLLIPEDKIGEYLDPGASKQTITDLFIPYPENLMEAYPTARFLRKEFAGRLNTEDVRKRIDYPELFFA